MILNFWFWKPSAIGAHYRLDDFSDCALFNGDISALRLHKVDEVRIHFVPRTGAPEARVVFQQRVAYRPGSDFAASTSNVRHELAAVYGLHEADPIFRQNL